MPASARWLTKTEPLDDGRSLRLTVADGSTVLSCRDIGDLWRQDVSFGSFFSRALAKMPFDAFFWEVRPITAAAADEPFECVAVNSPMLSGVRADSEPFGSELDASRSEDGMAVFENLGGDALLVAPCAGPDAFACTHLAAFVRNAPEPLQQAFWFRVGTALESRIGPAPVWISTSGLGVHWLHARLDRYPKYYTHAPYRHMEANQ